MSQVDGFLHGDVAPVRDLDRASDAADGEERCVVLIVDLHGILQTSRFKKIIHCHLKIWGQLNVYFY